VARDRKRSRQRREKPVRQPAAARSQRGVVRADLPGSLDHVGEVDEFDAALVRGAGGVPATDEAQNAAESEKPAEQAGRGVETAEKPRTGDGLSGNGAARGTLTGEAALPARRPSQPIGSRVAAFLRASWAELQRVQWPDRHQVTQATAVVLGFVAVMGIYLAVADWAAQKIVNFVL
jgi:preprotein translocase subunit SecE